MTANPREEIKKIVMRLKNAQLRFQSRVTQDPWFLKAKKYTQNQQMKYRKFINLDLPKIRAFTEREAQELRRLQTQGVQEIKKIQSYIRSQKKELQKVLGTIRTAAKRTTDSTVRAGKSSRASGTKSHSRSHRRVKSART